MQSQPVRSSRLEQRILVLLRAGARELDQRLPNGLKSVERSGVGFILLDYARTHPVQLGPVRLGPPTDRLSWKLPVAGHQDGQLVRGLWVARRWSSASRLSRFTEYQLSRQLHRGLARGASLGLAPEPSLPAAFLRREEGLHTELEIRSRSATSPARTAYLRIETYGELSGSVFANIRAAEEELQSWGPTWIGPSPTAESDTTAFATGPFALQPLVVHALQTASLPELLPGIESAVELDSAFRVVQRRMQPTTRALEGWRELPKGSLPLPPEGAYSLS